MSAAAIANDAISAIAAAAISDRLGRVRIRVDTVPACRLIEMAQRGRAKRKIATVKPDMELQLFIGDDRDRKPQAVPFVCDPHSASVFAAKPTTRAVAEGCSDDPDPASPLTGELHVGLRVIPKTKPLAGSPPRE